MTYIYENILDQIDATDVQSAQTVADGSADVEGDRQITVVIDKLHNEDFDKIGLKMSHLRQMNTVLNDYLDTLTLFDGFSVGYNTEATGFLPCDTFIDEFRKENPYTTNYSSFPQMVVRISYTMTASHTFRMFADAVFGIYSVIYRLLTERFRMRLNTASSVGIVLDDDTTAHNIKTLSYDVLWTHYCRFLEWDDLCRQKSGMEYVRTLHMNTAGVRLAPCMTTDSLAHLQPGDMLYFRKGTGFILKQDNAIDTDIPVAQYVYTDKSGAMRFASVRFMSQVNPKYGSTWPCDRISFGNLNNTVTTDGIIGTGDGLEITEATVNFINKMQPHSIVSRPKFYRYADCVWADMPLFDITMQFRTPGTRPGDWYVPAADELKVVYKNINHCDDVRRAHSIIELPEWEYATAWEIDQKNRVTFDMDTGHTHSDRKKEGRSEECALAFIRVVRR